LVTTARVPLSDELKRQKERGRELNEQVAGLENEVRRLTKEAEAARRTAHSARRSAPSRAAQMLARQAEGVARNALRDVWGARRLELLGKNGVDLLDALGEAKTELRRASSLLGPYWRKTRHIILISAAAAAVPVVAYLLVNVVKLPPLVSLLGGLAAVVPLLTTAIRSATSWTNERLAVLEEAEARIRDSIHRDIADKERLAAAAQRELEDTRQRLDEERARADQVAARTAELEGRIDELTPARVFVEFADRRSSNYRRYLGLLSTVRDDLESVQNEVRENNHKLLAGDTGGDAAMPNRIVLFIDDLDRCPPAKVVEVLEAVHLLLAFEMFVVVVAVDTRWLRSALTAQLRALTRNDADTNRPTPGDYMEKIFQLPYWVQPLTLLARSQLMRGLLAASVRAVDASSGDGHQPSDLQVGKAETEALNTMLGAAGTALRLETNQLALTADDLRFLESLAPLVGDTPRRVKRFVNICQLLLAMRPPLPPAGSFPWDRHVVCLLAALNTGLPAVADVVSASAKAGTLNTLGSIVAGSESPATPQWDLLGRWLDEHQQWKAVPLNRLDVRADVIQRMRFQPPVRTS
jgi:hypothetical protein